MNRRLTYQLAHVLLIPIYYFLLMIALRPERMIEILGAADFARELAVLSCLMMATIAGSRTIDIIVSKREGDFILPAVEIPLIALAFSFYAGFEVNVFAWFLINLLSVLALAYSLIYCMNQYYIMRVKNQELTSTDKMRFYDNKGRLRIILKAEDVFYIKADNNDVLINYIDNGVPCMLGIRNSMQAIEELCQYHGFLRVHRSYMVNPDHVTWLGRGDRNEVYVIFDRPDMPHVPVTKRYYDRIEEKVLIQNRP